MTGKHQVKGTRVERECRNDLDNLTASLVNRSNNKKVIEEQLPILPLPCLSELMMVVEVVIKVSNASTDDQTQQGQGNMKVPVIV